MALVGGGGASNTVNPAGTGKSLNYIGNHAYGYSGVIDIVQSDTEMLKFNTGNEYIKAKIAIQNGSGSGDDMRYEVKFNGEIVAQVYAGNSDNLNQFQFPLNLIIPPNSSILITGFNVSSVSGRAHSATLEGRVYA